jgi:hypothetical protein
MKKNHKKLYVILALVLVLAIVLLGYAYSKYKKSVEVTTTSTVAKWSFSGAVVDSQKSSVEDTISLADTVNSSAVKTGTIAPGTSGEFDIVIDATGSEVDIDYDVTVKDETSKPQNLYFTYGDDGKQYSTLEELLEKVNDDGTKEFSGTISKDADSAVKTYTISWNWPYETIVNGELQDDKDLEDASKDILDYTFTLVINGTQTNPTQNTNAN